MQPNVTVATINLSEVADLRRLVDLLAAVQVCWPSARVSVGDGKFMHVTTRYNPTGAMAA